MKQYYPIMATLILSLSDAFWFGYCYEKKKWFTSWLFKEYPMYGEMWVPYYRLLIQWPLDILALYLVYSTGGFWVTVLMIGAWYFAVKEYAYYLILNQFDGLYEMEFKNIMPYWLDRIYFATSFFFIGGFTVKKFRQSFVIGCIFLLASVVLGYLIN